MGESERDYDRILVASAYRIAAANRIKRAWKKFRPRVLAHPLRETDPLARLQGLARLRKSELALLKDLEVARLTCFKLYHSKKIYNSIDFHFLLSKLTLCQQLQDRVLHHCRRVELDTKVELLGEKLDLDREALSAEVLAFRKALAQWDSDPKWTREVQLGQKKKMIELKWLDKGMLAKRKGKKI